MQMLGALEARSGGTEVALGWIIREFVFVEDFSLTSVVWAANPLSKEIYRKKEC